MFYYRTSLDVSGIKLHAAGYYCCIFVVLVRCYLFLPWLELSHITVGQFYHDARTFPSYSLRFLP